MNQAKRTRPLVALLTDFGLQDEYVGVMKGVIAGISPRTRVVDISHQIGPQDIVQAAFVLAAAFPYFPPGTIYVAVVDPGVGGARRIVAAVCSGRFLLAPDNGLLEIVLREHSVGDVVAVVQTAHFLANVSGTFHGRDIFAPVAAHLARGRALADLGPAVDRFGLVTGVVPRLRFVSPASVEGVVVAVDHFGNLMTNIDAKTIDQLAGGTGHDRLQVEVSGRSIRGLRRFYGQSEQGGLLAIIGSRGLLEISVNGGNARQRLKAGKGETVRVRRPVA